MNKRARTHYQLLLLNAIDPQARYLDHEKQSKVAKVWKAFNTVLSAVAEEQRASKRAKTKASSMFNCDS